MKHQIWILIALALGACASTENDFYAAADGPGDYGYSEVQLEDNRYRVSFTGSAGTTDAAVKDLALMRAAELTMMEDYDWFRVVTVETEETTRTRNGDPATVLDLPEDTEVVYRECGPLGCTTTITEEYTGPDITITRDADRYVTTMEVIMGDGPVVDPTTVYNASALYDFLESRYMA